MRGGCWTWTSRACLKRVLEHAQDHPHKGTGAKGIYSKSGLRGTERGDATLPAVVDLDRGRSFGVAAKLRAVVNLIWLRCAPKQPDTFDYGIYLENQNTTGPLCAMIKACSLTCWCSYWVLWSLPKAGPW